VAVVLVVGCSVWCFNRFLSTQAFAPPISIETIKKVDSGSISFHSKKAGRIYVLLVDPHGDAHIHLLDAAGMTDAEILGIIEAKQKELEGSTGTKAEPANVLSKPAGTKE